MQSQQTMSGCKYYCDFYDTADSYILFRDPRKQDDPAIPDLSFSFFFFQDPIRLDICLHDRYYTTIYNLTLIRYQNTVYIGFVGWSKI